MKIAIIAPLHDYKTYQSQEEKDSLFFKGQGQYQWSKAFEELGHEVLEIRNTDYFGINKLDFFANTNRYLNSIIMKSITIKRIKKYFFIAKLKQKRDLERLLEFKPDILVFSGGNWIDIYSIEFFFDIKKNLLKSKIVLFNGMSPVKYTPLLEKEIVSLFDCVFTNDKYHAIEWKMIGAKNAVALPISAINPKIHYPRKKNKKYECDVSFVGSFYDNRHELCEYLYKNNINIKVWGSISQKIDKSSLFWKFYQGKANAIELQEIISSSEISINIQPMHIQSGGNMRTFEIPATKTFQLIDRYEKSWFEEGKEIVSYKDKKDLLNKIQYYLENDKKREEIAEAGYNKVLNEHTYRKRMQRVIDVCKNL
jgi:spore maturation protein CgeB